jgi:hypothetical protein
MYIYEIKYLGINFPCNHPEGILNRRNARPHKILLTSLKCYKTVNNSKLTTQYLLLLCLPHYREMCKCAIMNSYSIKITIWNRL